LSVAISHLSLFEFLPTGACARGASEHSMASTGKEPTPMSTRAILTGVRNTVGLHNGNFELRARRNGQTTAPIHLTAHVEPEDAAHRQAELFYLQKQIQSQTQMVIVLEDGEQIEGQIEWYDRQSLKVRGRAKTLVYKSAIKYMYKLGDAGQ
jgi:sRNA-binding regulator protein Hfq